MGESQTGQALALALGDYTNHSVHNDELELTIFPGWFQRPRALTCCGHSVDPTVWQTGIETLTPQLLNHCVQDESAGGYH